MAPPRTTAIAASRLTIGRSRSERRAKACHCPACRFAYATPRLVAKLRSGETGEIEVRGYLTQGYLGESAQFNATAFTSDGFFKTGDLGCLQQDGALHYRGRSSEMIKRSGINVSPAEVEEVLQQHPSVALAGVTGMSDPSKGELIVAYLTVKPETSIDVEAILEHCRTHLSRYKVPDRVYVCETLPLTPTGKLMRRELGDDGREGHGGKTGVVSDTGRWLCVHFFAGRWTASAASRLRRWSRRRSGPDRFALACAPLASIFPTS